MTNEGLYEAILQLKDATELQFAKVHVRFDRLESRFEGLEGKVDRLDHRMGRLETRVEHLETAVMRNTADLGIIKIDVAKIDARLSRVEQR